MHIRRLVGAAAVALTLFTVGCASEEGGEHTTPPEGQTQTQPEGGMQTQGTDAGTTPSTEGAGGATASDAGAEHGGGSGH